MSITGGNSKIKYAKGEASCIIRIGSQYSWISYFPIALHYFLEALKISERIGDKEGMATAYYDIGIVYKTQGDFHKYQFIFTLNGLDDVQLKMGNKELALGYYREAIRNGILYNDTLGLSSAYLRIANLYKAAGEQDSSKLYAEKSLFYAQR